LLGLDGGALVTETARTVIGGKDVASVAAAPEVEGALAGVFAARLTLGLAFGAGVVGVAAVWADVGGAAWAGADGGASAGLDGAACAGAAVPGVGGGTPCASAVTEGQTA
jgi:hypothetical protein